MADWISGIELLGAIATQPNPGQVVADFRTLYAAYTDAKAKGLDVAGMVKAGTLQAEVGALARTATLTGTLLADKTHGPQLISFIESLIPSPEPAE